jgi:hypothetical protein
VRHDLGISHDRELLARLTDRAMLAEVASHARCADGGLDPDAWFPVSTDAEAARPRGRLGLAGKIPRIRAGSGYWELKGAASPMEMPWEVMVYSRMAPS